MRAIFLGTADGHTSNHREHSGILLQAGSSMIQLDCGSSMAQYLKRQNIDPNQPEILWISHMHSDHVGHLSMLFQSLWLRKRKAPLHVYGPTRVLADIQAWLIKTILFPSLIGFPVEWHGVTPGQAEKQGAFTLTPFATNHLDGLAAGFAAKHPECCFECFGVRIEHEGLVYVYSADVDHPREMQPALQGPIKALISELTHFPEEELFKEIASAQIEAVWLTHYPDQLMGEEEKMRKLAKEHKFLGQVHLVEDKSSHEI